MKIAVVVPVCNEQHTLEALAEGIAAQLAEHDYRILFIDDGSTDVSYRKMLTIRSENDRVDVLKFSENQGKTRALAVAFGRVDADVVVTMDADLQDDPAELPRLLAKLDEGLDLVCGWKEKRHDPIHKTLPSKVYNGAIGKIFGLDIHDVNTGYKAMRGEVAKSLTLYADLHRLIPVMAAQKGFKVGEIAVKHHARQFGKSKYGMSRFYEGIRDAARLWFGARAERYAWVNLAHWQLATGVGLVLTVLGVVLVLGEFEPLLGAAVLGVGIIQTIASFGLVLAGNLSRALDRLAAAESGLDVIAEEHCGEA